MTESRYRELMTAIEDDGARAVRDGLDEAHRATFPVWLVLYIGPVWSVVKGLASYLARLVVRAVLRRIGSLTISEASELILRARSESAAIEPPRTPIAKPPGVDHATADR